MSCVHLCLISIWWHQWHNTIVSTCHHVSRPLYRQGSLWRSAVTVVLAVRAGLCVLCLAYFQQIGEPGSGLPKSSSYKEMKQDCLSKVYIPSSPPPASAPIQYYPADVNSSSQSFSPIRTFSFATSASSLLPSCGQLTPDPLKERSPIAGSHLTDSTSTCKRTSGSCGTKALQVETVLQFTGSGKLDCSTDQSVKDDSSKKDNWLYSTRHPVQFRIDSISTHSSLNKDSIISIQKLIFLLCHQLSAAAIDLFACNMYV